MATKQKPNGQAEESDTEVEDQVEDQEVQDEVDPERSVAQRQDEDPDDQDQDGEGRHGAETPEERTERRRQERQAAKQRRREAIGRKDRHIAMVERQNQELASRLAALEDRTSSGDMARLNGAIENAMNEVELAKSARTEAMKANDSVIFEEADTILHNARRKHEELTNLRARIENDVRRRGDNGGGGGRERSAVTVDPRVTANATRWAKANKWFDPNLGDTDSRIVRMLDRELHSEGWDPATKEYWDELNDRISERVPRRKLNPIVSDDTDDDQDERDDPAPRPRRSITAGAGGESPGGKTVTHTLSAERVQALKDANMWDDTKTRARMIKKYQAHDKEAAANRR